MRIPPIAILAGLGAVAAAVMLSSSKSKATTGAPLPVDPSVGPVGPGGPSLPVDPGVAYDCTQGGLYIEQAAVAISAAENICQKNPKAPECGAIAGWKQSLAAIAQAYQAHGCRPTSADYDCQQMQAWLADNQPVLDYLSRACKQGTDPNACQLYNSWAAKAAGMRQAYQQSCGAVQERPVAATFVPSGALPTIPNVPMLGGECPPGFEETGSGDCQWDGVLPNADGSCNPGYDIGDDGWCHLLSGVRPSQGMSITNKCEQLAKLYDLAETQYQLATQAALTNPAVAASLPALAQARARAEEAALGCVG